MTFKEGIEILDSLKEWYTYRVYVKKFNVIMVCYLRNCIDEK
ncbi:hypothetical protein [Deferribacter autotrophicus]|nr:hypothetical protein [Deferribacter autotrophicus]